MKLKRLDAEKTLDEDEFDFNGILAAPSSNDPIQPVEYFTEIPLELN